MAVLPIVKEPQKILRKKAAEVRLSLLKTPKIQGLILNMKKTLKNTPDGVGLAAPQVGESLRVFIISEEAEEIDKAKKEGWERRRNENGKPSFAKASEGEKKPYEEREWKYYVFINPAVKKLSQQKKLGPEGCLSVPGKYGDVKRTEKITVEAYDENGKKFTRGASKFFARVIQHELDHLKGVLFIDKAEQLREVHTDGKGGH